MKKDTDANAQKEWAAIMKEHPKLAKAFLAQQLMLRGPPPRSKPFE